MQAKQIINVTLFESVINSFLQSKEFNQLRHTTKKGYRSSIEGNGLIRDSFKNTPLAAFEDRKMRSIIKSWLAKHKVGTARNLLAMLQRLLSYAFDEGMIGNNALAKMRKPKIKDRSTITWTKDEINLMKQAPRYVLRILMVTLETGLRPSDSFRLRLSNFHRTKTENSRFELKRQRATSKLWRLSRLRQKCRRFTKKRHRIKTPS